ncbi:hypothetical protein GCM10023170_095630 [Phytohabitans houttuyneae]|uniref:Uncharacterized protein n=1 Tax=Phytohabitans houttuyneae TaxID=1076126 RepID=A0A6V8K495_9ACTN|nr:hypothetical protein Phou_014010 [Phytohabitans houttuyneae]
MTGRRSSVSRLHNDAGPRAIPPDNRIVAPRNAFTPEPDAGRAADIGRVTSAQGHAEGGAVAFRAG